jgi:hypothetical protein
MKTRTLSGHITSNYTWGGSFDVFYRVNGGKRVNRKHFNTRIEAKHFLHQMPKPTAYEMIQYHMRENEKSVLKHIRELMKEGKGLTYFLLGRAWSGAVDRLQKRGILRYSKKVHGYVIVKKGR